MLRFKNTQVLWLAMFVAVSGGLVLTTTNKYYLLVLSLVFIWATLGLGWNILGGYAGIISFGHSAMFGGGAYMVAILFAHYDVSPWVGWLAGGVFGAISGLIIGAITFRLRGQYFSLATLSFPLAIQFFLEWLAWNEVSLPMRRDAPWLFMEFSDPRVLPLLALALLAISLALCHRIERSRFGLSLFAIRQDELAASTAGIDTQLRKLQAIGISGALAGLAGGLFAVVVVVVTPPSTFGMLVSAQALIVPMFGGVGTLWGPLIGAFTLVPVSELLNATLAERFPGVQGVVFGLAIMGIVIWAPLGLYWAILDRVGPYLRGSRKSVVVASDSSIVSEVETSNVVNLTKIDRAGEELLRVEGLSVRFGGLAALNNVSFGIRRGEILGIIGPNGAGKSTLFNAINGIMRSTGSIKLRGKEVRGTPPDELCALGVARTFQTVRAFTRLSLLDNVLVGAFRRFPNDADARKAAYEALSCVGLSNRASEPASVLNSRELRLMELARALAGQPTIILMDECFAGLSSADVEIMVDLSRRLRDQGLTIAIIEHTMSAMVRLADRLIVLDHGVKLMEGVPQEVTRDKTVIEAYLGQEWAEHAAG